VSRITAFEFLFDLWVGVLPERGQVRGFLHRAIIGRQDVEGDVHPVHQDFKPALHADEIPEAR